ncbi:MAG: hypothetical protein D6732_22930 [Methanobacteriota archaeon]|nr:MAG: hypothetical protein D6732_22930 [Euryarchaeota archaeon]
MDIPLTVFLAPVFTRTSFNVVASLAQKGYHLVFISDDEDLLELLSFEVENLGGIPYPFFCSFGSEKQFKSTLRMVEKVIDHVSTVILFSEENLSHSRATISTQEIADVLLKTDWISKGIGNELFLVDLGGYQDQWTEGIENSMEQLTVIQSTDHGDRHNFEKYVVEQVEKSINNEKKRRFVALLGRFRFW